MQCINPDPHAKYRGITHAIREMMTNEGVFRPVGEFFLLFYIEINPFFLFNLGSWYAYCGYSRWTCSCTLFFLL